MTLVQLGPIRFGFRWWVLPYLRLLEHLTVMFGYRPDWDKVTARILKGIWVQIGDKRVPLDL